MSVISCSNMKKIINFVKNHIKFDVWGIFAIYCKNYRVLQKKCNYFGWSLFGENLNNKLNMRDIESQ